MTLSYWRDLAACNLDNAALFDEVRFGEPDPLHRIARAVTVCRSCPVTIRCLTDAVSSRDSGVRGGRYLMRGVEAA